MLKRHQKSKVGKTNKQKKPKSSPQAFTGGECKQSGMGGGQGKPAVRRQNRMVLSRLLSRGRREGGLLVCCCYCLVVVFFFPLR